MHAPRAVLVVLIAGLLSAATVVFAAPSSAGGPTSVLLVNPSTGRATALYTTDPRYQRLSDAVGAFDSTPAGATTSPSTGPGSPTDDAGINVTWLVHDVQVWRVDRIYLDGAGGALIASQSDVSGASVWDTVPVWHRPTDAADLAELLTGLGLGPAAAPAATAGSPAASSSAAVPLEQVEPVAATGPRAVGPAAAPGSSGPAGPGGISGPLWALVGAVAGAALAAGLGRARARPAGAELVG